jgi:hypothetical protein
MVAPSAGAGPYTVDDDHGTLGHGKLVLIKSNNHELFAVIGNWLDDRVGARR